MFEYAVTFGLPVLASSGDPRLYAESLARFASLAGLDVVFFYGYILYLAPLLSIGLAATAACFLRKKGWLVRWPDVGLVTIPALLWLALGVVYPFGRPTATIWELVVLGAIAGFTILGRYGHLSMFRTGFANAGLLGVTSLAICFWAFVPSGLYL